jgi:hypothetical protein
MQPISRPLAAGTGATWPNSLPFLAIVLTLLIIAHPTLASAQGATARAIVSSVQHQRPGIDGNPGAVGLILALLINRPQPLAENTTLMDKDGLLGEDADSAVQLVCANGATLVLSGQFDAYLRLGNNGAECTVYLRAGTAIATTAPGEPNANTIPTIIQYGTVTLGARSTQFGATIVSDRGAPDTRADAFVIEGTVEMQQSDPAGPAVEPLVLQTGQLLAAHSTQIAAIDDTRFDTMAATYAKLEVQTIPVAQRAAVEVELQQAYARTLRHPRDVGAQRSLLAVYRTRGLTNAPAATYHDYQLNRATNLQPEAIQ